MKGRKVPDPPIDHAAALRERLGRVVRDAWVAWAREQPNPEPRHLLQWEALSEEIREVDRRIGMAVMDAIVKKGDKRGNLSVSSSYGAATKKPYVELSVDTSPSQLSPGKAREIAMMLLEAADAAESDAVIMEFARESIGLDERKAAQLLDQFRQFRDRFRDVGSA